MFDEEEDDIVDDDDENWDDIWDEDLPENEP
jgi:hypothetical protein